jgi:hypothetical protein
MGPPGHRDCDAAWTGRDRIRGGSNRPAGTGPGHRHGAAGWVGSLECSGFRHPAGKAQLQDRELRPASPGSIAIRVAARGHRGDRPRAGHRDRRRSRRGGANAARRNRPRSELRLDAARLPDIEFGHADPAVAAGRNATLAHRAAPRQRLRAGGTRFRTRRSGARRRLRWRAHSPRAVAGGSARTDHRRIRSPRFAAPSCRRFESGSRGQRPRGGRPGSPTGCASAYGLRNTLAAPLQVGPLDCGRDRAIAPDRRSLAGRP